MTKRPETPTDKMRAAREVQESEQTKEAIRYEQLLASVLDEGRGPELMAKWDEILLLRPTPSDISDGALRGLEHTRNFHRANKVRIANFRERGQGKQ